MNDVIQKRVDSRLVRIGGHVQGLEGSVENDRYRIDILAQNPTVISALKGVEEDMTEHHLHAYVTHAMHQDDPQETDVKIQEVIHIISRFR